jgi:hypothetical protein
LGLALLALAAGIIWNWGDIVIADLFAAWLVYHGCKLSIGSFGWLCRASEG